MITFLKKHSISLALLFVSGIVGTVLVFLQTPKDIWLVEYGFSTRNTKVIPKFAQADTVFLYEGNLIRNYTSSIGDTLRDDSLSVHEIKINIAAPSTEKQISELGNRVLNNEAIDVRDTRFQETQRNKSMLLFCVLFGFFLGMVVEFIGGLKKHPGTTENG